MKTRSIIVMVAPKDKAEESWIEEWLGYKPDLTEEQAIEEVEEVMARFHKDLRPYEEERVAISFIISPVREDKDIPWKV